MCGVQKVSFSQLPFLFDKPLFEAVIIKRNSQFTMDVMINNEITKCHCPTTGRIGDIDTKNIACLISESKDKKRKLKYTVKAISCDNLNCHKKKWIGINQILSNKVIEYYLTTNQLDLMVTDYTTIKREVSLGCSKLDFLVGNTYMEVKTPLNTLHVKYGSSINTKPISPFSSTERFTKHIKELAESLNEHKRAILLTVHQYEPTVQKSHQRSTNYKEVSAIMSKAIKKGLETWNINFKFTPTGIHIIFYENTSKNIT